MAGYARDRGLLVIADAKRGDIDITAAAYAQAYFGETATPFGPVAGLGADALTANPLLGADSLEPLVDAARARGSGVFVLVRTSNPGAADVQELELADGRHVSDRLAEIVAELGAGAVGGAGHRGHRRGRRRDRARAARGAARADAARELPAPGGRGAGRRGLRAGRGVRSGPAGGLVSASRSIVYAHEKRGGDPADAAAREAAALRELAWGMVCRAPA